MTTSSFKSDGPRFLWLLRRLFLPVFARVLKKEFFKDLRPTDNLLLKNPMTLTCPAFMKSEEKNGKKTPSEKKINFEKSLLLDVVSKIDWRGLIHESKRVWGCLKPNFLEKNRKIAVLRFFWDFKISAKKFHPLPPVFYLADAWLACQ